MHVLETRRLRLRRLGPDDAPFILRLLNEPSWLRYIGDKGVRTQDDARRYIENGPVAMYARLGFGLYRVELKTSGEPVGMCGLVKRESLEHADIGFAMLPEFWGRGYAFESASAIMATEPQRLGFSRILAIASIDNHASARLLDKLGFRFERNIRLQPDAEELRLYEASV